MLYSRLFIECTRVYDIVSSIDFNVDHVTQIQVENFNENNVVYMYMRISKRKKKTLESNSKTKTKNTQLLTTPTFFYYFSHSAETIIQSIIDNLWWQCVCIGCNLFFFICSNSDGTCFFYSFAMH